MLASVSQWCCFAFEPIATMVGLGSLPDIRETSLPAAVSQEVGCTGVAVLERLRFGGLACWFTLRGTGA